MGKRLVNRFLNALRHPCQDYEIVLYPFIIFRVHQPQLILSDMKILKSRDPKAIIKPIKHQIWSSKTCNDSG